jgi:hypothetical protein
MLTSQEVENYFANGFVVPEFRLPPDQIASINQDMLELIEQNPGRPNDGMPGAHMPRDILPSQDIPT